MIGVILNDCGILFMILLALGQGKKKRLKELAPNIIGGLIASIIILIATSYNNNRMFIIIGLFVIYLLFAVL
jgi:hypothetical protein